MKYLIVLLFSCLCNLSYSQEVETLVFLRHAEKPDEGLGQLNCQGLHRSLKLPSVLIDKFGKPDLIFATNPSIQKKDKGNSYDYIRPLATIEPTAVTLGMPINTQFGFEDIEGLKKVLLKDELKNKTIFIAWEHRLAEDLVKSLMKQFNNNDVVPTWDGYDFDSLYIVKISSINNVKKIDFIHSNENLNNQNKNCNFN